MSWPLRCLFQESKTKGRQRGKRGKVNTSFHAPESDFPQVAQALLNFHFFWSYRLHRPSWRWNWSFVWIVIVCIYSLTSEGLVAMKLFFSHNPTCRPFCVPLTHRYKYCSVFSDHGHHDANNNLSLTDNVDTLRCDSQELLLGFLFPFLSRLHSFQTNKSIE